MFLLLHCPLSERGLQGFFLYRQKRQCNDNKLQGKRWWFDQMAVLAVWGHGQGFAGQKVKVPASPLGLGRGYK